MAHHSRTLSFLALGKRSRRWNLRWPGMAVLPLPAGAIGPRSRGALLRKDVPRSSTGFGRGRLGVKRSQPRTKTLGSRMSSTTWNIGCPHRNDAPSRDLASILSAEEGGTKRSDDVDTHHAGFWPYPSLTLTAAGRACVRHLVALWSRGALLIEVQARRTRTASGRSG